MEVLLGARGGFCSSPAASLLIMLRTNMKHTHAMASSHTHLTSIKNTVMEDQASEGTCGPISQLFS